MDSTGFTQQNDSRELLLLGLYVRGVFGFEETRQWACELGLDRTAQKRLMDSCVRAHFAAPGELLAA